MIPLPATANESEIIGVVKNLNFGLIYKFHTFYGHG